MLVFIDLETTGLDPDKDCILELAAVACDDDLKEISRLHTFVRPVTPLEHMPPKVRQMHLDSGLLNELCSAWADDGTRFEVKDNLPRRFEVEKIVLAWLDGIVPPDLGTKKPPLGGSSVHFDRAFLKAHMPELEKRLAYRNVDASSFYEGALRWAPALTREGMEPEAPKTKHRAMDDILFSIERLRVYRRELFLPWQNARTPQPVARESSAR